MRQHRSSTKSDDAHWSRRKQRGDLNKDPEPPLRLISAAEFVCWCGDTNPHPRHERPPAPLTPHQQRVQAVLAIEAAGICPVCYGRDTSCKPCMGTGTFPPPRNLKREIRTEIER